MFYVCVSMLSFLIYKDWIAFFLDLICSLSLFLLLLPFFPDVLSRIFSCPPSGLSLCDSNYHSPGLVDLLPSETLSPASARTHFFRVLPPASVLLVLAVFFVLKWKRHNVEKLGVPDEWAEDGQN